MKIKKIVYLTVLLLILQNSVNKIKASDIIGTTIEITEGTINMFINEQYSKFGLPNNINGNYNGVIYDINLYLPNIRLLKNQAKIEFGFNIESNVFNGEINFEDNISFYVSSINELNIKGVSDAFRDKVNLLNIHSVLKTVIISAWESLQLEVYPMKLAKKVENSKWLSERSISLIDPYFSVSFNVDPGKLKIDLNTYLESREYLVAGLFYENSKWWLKIGAGSQINIKEVYIYDSSGRLIKHGTDLGVCPKKGVLSIPINGSLAYAYYTTKILYTTNNTFYVRGYKSIPGGYVEPNNILN